MTSALSFSKIICKAHIEKEDKVFFPSTEEYFSQGEQQSMLQEFWEFDKKMIHEKYKSLVEHLEREKG